MADYFVWRYPELIIVIILLEDSLSTPVKRAQEPKLQFWFSRPPTEISARKPNVNLFRLLGSSSFHVNSPLIKTAILHKKANKKKTNWLEDIFCWNWSLAVSNYNSFHLKQEMILKRLVVLLALLLLHKSINIFYSLQAKTHPFGTPEFSSRKCFLHFFVGFFSSCCLQRYLKLFMNKVSLIFFPSFIFIKNLALKTLELQETF